MTEITRSCASFHGRVREMQAQQGPLHVLALVGAAGSLVAVFTSASVPALIEGVLVAGLFIELRRYLVENRFQQDEPLPRATPTILTPVLLLMIVQAGVHSVASATTAAVAMLALTGCGAIAHDRSAMRGIEAALLDPRLPSTAPRRVLEELGSVAVLPRANSRTGRRIDAPPGGRCAACGTADGPHTWTACRACEAPHHQECWDYVEGCAIFGCGAHEAARPAPPARKADVKRATC